MHKILSVKEIQFPSTYIPDSFWNNGLCIFFPTLTKRSFFPFAVDAEEFTVTITPGETLPNGTIYVFKHSKVSFNCSSRSQQKSNISWNYIGPDSKQETFVNVEGTYSEFTLSNVDSDNQGNYTCSTNESVTKEVLVYRKLLC